VARKLLISLSRYLETGMVPTGDEVTLFRAALARSPPGSASIPIFLVVRHEQIAKKRSPKPRVPSQIFWARHCRELSFTKVGGGRLKRLRDAPESRPPQTRSAECSRWIDSAQKV
jgi:hypothetical protein